MGRAYPEPGATRRFRATEPTKPTRDVRAHFRANVREIANNPHLLKEGSVAHVIWETYVRDGNAGICEVALMINYPPEHKPGDRINHGGAWTLWFKVEFFRTLLVTVPVDGMGVRSIDFLPGVMFVYLA